jgi:hypothetical protein
LKLSGARQSAAPLNFTCANRQPDNSADAPIEGAALVNDFVDSQ